MEPSKADNFIWYLLKNGRFSIRSAYNLARNLADSTFRGSSRNVSGTQLDFTWKSRARHHVQLLGWKGEDNFHVFLGCPYSRLYGLCRIFHGAFLSSGQDVVRTGCVTNRTLLEYGVEDLMHLLLQAQRFRMVVCEAMGSDPTKQTNDNPEGWNRPEEDWIKDGPWLSSQALAIPCTSRQKRLERQHCLLLNKGGTM
ncbi:hypothetical protein Salat_0517500 [Sesamum alatum]|uniref:Uncharacterized protein n=1 Tax=Sesamum alatum TaxID=300844 RepID=A0AAE1Z5C0_9LAMI|nr:hypothetical protein Salat_0517500 [Sesamum alatum]